MNLENYFISQFQNNHIGDDGAYIDGMVYSKDAFFENVHFKKEWMGHFEIAHKAMMVNISDALAMQAKPYYALLSVAMPKTTTKEEMRQLAAGFKSAAKSYDIEIIGGDTLSNTKLDITVTIISKTKKPLRRTTLRYNYLLAYTGTLGSSYKALTRLLRGGNISHRSKFITLKLQKDFLQRSERILKAGMDISDGLWSDLAKITAASRVGVNFNTKIPKYIACSGEEYEMLVAIDPRDKKALKRRALQSRTPITFFATVTRNHYANRCRAHHF